MRPRKETMRHDFLLGIITYDPETGVFRWKVRRNHVPAGAIAGCQDRRGYVFIGIQGKLYTAHRLAVFYMTGEWPSRDTDHVNGVKSDNRWANIRVATRIQNNGNSRPRTTRLKGTSLKPSGRWVAQIVHNKTHYYLGLYSTEEAAHEAYQRAARKFYQEFARFK